MNGVFHDTRILFRDGNLVRSVNLANELHHTADVEEKETSVAIREEKTATARLKNLASREVDALLRTTTIDKA